MPTTFQPSLRTLTLDSGMTLGYRELGTGPAVLLVHGWPASSLLWRAVMPAIAAHHRVIAIDLPGFGASDKPVDVRYDFPLFATAVDGLLSALDVDRVALAGHDIGGPIATHWALRNQGRTRGLALLNTLVYPEFSPTVAQFVRDMMVPETRDRITSPAGLTAFWQSGLAGGAQLPADVLAAVLEPFAAPADRRALAKAGIGLGIDGFAEIAAGLPGLAVPTRVIYGEQDQVLPDVAETMARVRADLPATVVTALPDCGHFVTEQRPDEVGALLAEFFGALPA